MGSICLLPSWALERLLGVIDEEMKAEGRAGTSLGLTVSQGQNPGLQLGSTHGNSSFCVLFFNLQIKPKQNEQKLKENTCKHKGNSHVWGNMVAGILYKHSHSIPITTLQKIIILLLWTREPVEKRFPN